ncbi:hypothetical protein PG994_013180 [Apiospora phragmitis]|uniref:NAD(P)-binding protein n=1 Tax=Apiospora phragmitis TaxID=2905665 RepID=A0ABR1T8E9_9PEZI
MAETHHFDVSRLFGVKGYVAVVTGGGSGIGLMAAQALAQNGAKVYITGRRMEALEAAAKSHDPSHVGQIIPVGPCDVTKKDDLEKLVAQMQEKEKYIHLLVCNAGVSGPKAEPKHKDAADLKKELWEKESVEQWGQTFEVDVTSVYFTTVAFLPLLQAGTRAQGGPLEPFAPSVITISSMSGLMRHAQGHFSYNAAKGATVHLSKLMSAEFQKAGIRRREPEEPPGAREDPDKEHVPLMRAGREEEMGMTVLYLARNQYVNGEIIAVDGGVLNVLAGR